MTDQSVCSTHRLIAVHAEDGVTEFEAPGEDANDATSSEKAIMVEDRLQQEYGAEPNCVILPSDAPPNHPLVQQIDEAMPELGLVDVLRERDRDD